MMDRVGEILRATAQAVVMPRFAALGPGDIVMKGVNDPVTIADGEAEAMIGRELRLLLPHARIVGEEACSANPALLEKLGEGTVWIVDPIDGTANFAAGRPPFAMMVALLEQGELVGSWILDPLSDRLAVAERGGGAWMDGKRLTASAAPTALEGLSGIVSEAFVPAGERHVIERLRAAAGSVQQTARCAGHEYPLVAAGERHFILYWRTLVWDHAPGALLLTEAGGSATYLDGSPYDPCRSQTGLLLAHNSLISRALLDVIAQQS
jgi:fructose-1,6-bisphosphatase/inositol monophosphatase family enzyme